ncbi:hypothetical protein Dimus_013743 [Dionaea muscipula]
MVEMAAQAFAVVVMLAMERLMNGKRGGNGASKNKIGSRGEDKVVLVPVGTVIHLVEGDISSPVERHCIGDSDPWEIRGTLTSDASQSNEQRSNSSSLSAQNVEKMEVCRDVSSQCTERVVGKSTATQESSQLSSITYCSQPLASGNKPRYCHQVSLSGSDYDSNCGNEVINTDDNPGIDNVVSEDDWNDEEDNIRYGVAELTEEGQQIVVAHGGEGGLGNASCVNVSMRENTSGDENPTFTAGLCGSDAIMILELKTIADVGLVGMPNAGKSTLLGAISRAKPAVGHYAFTTLRPNIGKLNYDDFSVTVADIPGLIKGAHENRGLGHAFLRHIERTKVLAYVVDLAAALDGRKGIPPWEQLKVLALELEYYKEGLASRPSLVVANKIDEGGAECVYEELQKRVQVPVFPVSAILEEGIIELKAGLRQLVNDGE